MSQLPVEIYTEFTPNPESLKFVANRMFLRDASLDCRTLESASASPMATEIFSFPYVSGVFIMNNFVTVSKKPGYDWNDIIPEMKEFIKGFVASGKEFVTGDVAPQKNEEAVAADKEGELETRIRELLDTYVKPAVEMDGGAIQFKSFHEGTVTLQMQGSCSGCPSSTLTLKSGIEGLLKRMVPEVKEVVAEGV